MTKRRKFFQISTAACLWFAASSALQAADLRAGAAEVVISPPLGTDLAGYYENRFTTAVHDDLHAKAIVLEANGTKVALVACDLISIPRPIIEEARTLIQSQTGIPPSAVMISATHTHTGPVIIDRYMRYNLEGEAKKLVDNYAAALPGKIAQAVAAAAAALQPAQLRAAIGEESSLVFNRRYFMKDGTVGWNPGKLNPKIERPAGPIDPAVPLFYLETADGKPIASYVNYALHSDTMSGKEVSADFSGVLAKCLTQAKGAGFVSVFTMGCAGNINHIDVSTKTLQSGPNETARIGSVLAGEVLKTIKNARTVPISSIRTESEIVKLPLQAFQPEEIAWARKTSATFGQPNAAPFNDLVRAAKIVEVAERDGAPLEAEVQVIALGDQIALVSWPAEVFTELGLTLKQDSPFPITIVATLANGALGYIPNHSASYEGAYEVLTSRCAPGGGELIQDAAFRELFHLFQTARQQTQ